MIDLLAKDGDVPITDANGTTIIVPSFPKLRTMVTSLTDALTGAVAEARDINSQSLAFSVDAQRSADAAQVSADAAKVSETNLAQAVHDSAASATASAASATAAADSKAAAAASATAASASATAAKGSEDTAKTSMDNAGFSAGAAKTYRDDAQLARDMSSAYANAPVNSEVSPGQFSAFHWAEQARLIAVGAVIYKGSWDASGGTMPATPKLGDFYFISKAGVVGGTKWASGDMAVFDGVLWERIDNQQAVTTVAGRTGAITLTIADIASLQASLDGKLDATSFAWASLPGKPATFAPSAHTHVIADTTGLQSALDAKQAALGYTPVQAGTGVGQSTNVIKIGYAGSKLKLTVDSTDFGNMALESWVSGKYLDLAGGTLTGVVRSSTWISATDPIATAGIANGGNGGNRGLVAQANNNGGGTATSSATMTFIRDGLFGCYFGLDTDSKLKVGGWSYGNAAFKVLHEGENVYTFNGGLHLRAGSLMGKLTTAHNPGSFSAGSGDGCDQANNNMAIYSWYGVGFGPSISGQGIPLGEFSHWFNTRSGDMGCRGSIVAWGNVGGYGSDRRLKQNFRPIHDAMGTIHKLNGYLIDWNKEVCEAVGFKPDHESEHVLIAQDVQAAIPEAAIPAGFNKDYLTILEKPLMPFFVEALKQLHGEINDLKARVAELEGSA